MPHRLSAGLENFSKAFDDLLSLRFDQNGDIQLAVSRIIQDVRERGDKAVIEYTRKFDRLDIGSGYRVDTDLIESARDACAPEQIDALINAASRIRAFHSRQIPEEVRYTDEEGVVLGTRWSPISSVGIYVPGGTACYPSSVLMNAIPAMVAGVSRVAMVVPTPDGKTNPLVLAAADIAGISEVYRIGGAQAIAAFTFGTETIRPVDKITGPGNAYVAEAKRQVFGKVGIDMVAGPSEILVLADSDNNPAWIAADLLSQAEHDHSSQSILITDSAALADAVSEAVDTYLLSLPRADTARASWENFGAIILVPGLDAATPLINKIAPEHLELAVKNPEEYSKKIKNAGAIFLGPHTPEAIGDYVAGPNHVLPTSRSARFSSGLGVMDFMKRTNIVGCDSASLSLLGGDAITLALAEGLDAHALSVKLRLESL